MEKVCSCFHVHLYTLETALYFSKAEDCIENVSVKPTAENTEALLG